MTRAAPRNHFTAIGSSKNTFPKTAYKSLLNNKLCTLIKKLLARFNPVAVTVLRDVLSEKEKQYHMATLVATIPTTRRGMLTILAFVLVSSSRCCKILDNNFERYELLAPNKPARIGNSIMKFIIYGLLFLALF